MKSRSKKNENGITLIALVVTIVILIILATISINLILGDGGLVSRSQKSGEEYKIAGAREKLDITLGDAQIEKRINKKYNQNEFLNEFILKELPDVQIEDDIVIVDGYAFEIDRSVPKIGKYVGTEKNMVFPDLDVTVKNAENKKSATITITAKEETNGIKQIEILQDGIAIKRYTYDNVKEEITEDYVVKQNGAYTVKVYAEHTKSKKAEVSGLIEVVKYNPNGSETYKKEHNVTITVDETIEKVKSIRYQWLQTTEEPEETSFTQTCNNGDTITKNEVTGKWYLWTLVETESGEKDIGRSEGFNFDNQGPKVELTAASVSEKSFRLTATAHDDEVEIAKYEFYVNDELVETVPSKAETATCEVKVETMGEYECYVIVTDSLGNATRAECNEARTQMHVWEKWSTNSTSTYIKETNTTTTSFYVTKASYYSPVYNSYSYNASTGVFSGVGTRVNCSWYSTNAQSVCGKYEINSSSKVSRYTSQKCRETCSAPLYWSATWYLTVYTSKADVNYSKGESLLRTSLFCKLRRLPKWRQ